MSPVGHSRAHRDLPGLSGTDLLTQEAAKSRAAEDVQQRWVSHGGQVGGWGAGPPMLCWLTAPADGCGVNTAPVGGQLQLRT